MNKGIVWFLTFSIGFYLITTYNNKLTFDNQLACRDLFDKQITNYNNDLNDFISFREVVSTVVNVLKEKKSVVDESPACIMLPPETNITYSKKKNTCIMYIAKRCNFNSEPKEVTYRRLIDINTNEILKASIISNEKTDKEFDDLYSSYFNR